MLKLKLQYFGLLIQRANSLEKTLKLGKNEGKRRRGQQRMRWLDSVTDSMDEFEQTLGISEGQRSLACYSPWSYKDWGHTWATEQQLMICKVSCKFFSGWHPHGSECIHCLNFILIISVDLSSLSKYSGTFGQRAYLLSPWHQTQRINHPFHPFLMNSVILMARIPNIPSKLESVKFYLTWIQSRLLVVIFWINVIMKSSMVSLGSWGKNVIIN